MENEWLASKPKLAGYAVKALTFVRAHPSKEKFSRPIIGQQGAFFNLSRFLDSHKTTLHSFR